MTTRIVVDLPDHIYRRIESMARQSQRDVNAESVIDRDVLNNLSVTLNGPAFITQIDIEE